MDLGLEGKVILVTGGSDGLGRALCTTLVAEGARVALCARGAERIGALVDELRAAGGDVEPVVGDVRDEATLVGLVETAVSRWARIDGVVNNAGRSAAAAVPEVSDDEWHQDLDLKLLAAARLCRLALPHLAVRGGAVVNVLAIGAKTPGAASAPSSVSRAAGLALTKALSKDVGPQGVRVNAVLIGLVRSGQWERAAAERGSDLEEFYAAMGAGAGIPLGRVGQSAEFADLVAFLLSERAAYVSGTGVNLDGGLSAAP